MVSEKDMVTARVAGFIAFISGSVMAAQELPLIPDDFKSWPVTAILGVVCIFCLALVFYIIRKNFESQNKVAEALLASAHSMDSLTNKMEKRPCLTDINE
jgi:uncharacterized membrane protein